VLELVTPRLRPGAVVFADNIFTFRRALAITSAHAVRPPRLVSTTLHVIGRLQYSVRVGKA
jgi:predicted O-methyltransferase YrrM